MIVQDPLTALRAIADGRLPCVACGKVHEQRAITVRDKQGKNQPGRTWADPDDGHAYRRPDPSEFARQVAGA